ncbi:uncharacterized protein (TIGR04222 family) [Actinokineospora baliensis]|uniref:TIGR04222 domain-containing membrane protein n=1 Tax=Actinokineospora baliensis TaxID=547056 RepID=UPI00195B0CF4|nr:TIGR04222 domain-containing membrane protein [Actinokineospora baliensis]MBM7774055.1 uncharacterized protein (TIGR04222 family) [Actinokineospora baliensis]
MATSRVGLVGGLRLEELGLLSGGPGRAAEVAIVAMLDARVLRMSRGGTVTAISGPTEEWSSLERSLRRSTPRTLGSLVRAGAESKPIARLREGLVERGYLRSAQARRKARRMRWLVLAVASAAFGGMLFTELSSEVASVVLIAGFVVAAIVRRGELPLTSAGRAAVREPRTSAITSKQRLPLVASLGLNGTIQGQPVWQALGLDPAAASTLEPRPKNSSDSSGGCGSCSGSSGDSGDSSCGGGCGGGGD